jgi:hypothetical protein
MITRNADGFLALNTHGPTVLKFPDQTETEITSIFKIMTRVMEFGSRPRGSYHVTVMGLSLVYNELSLRPKSNCTRRTLSNKGGDWAISIDTVPADSYGSTFEVGWDERGRYRKFTIIAEGCAIWGREGLMNIKDQSFTGDLERCKRDLVIARMVGEEFTDWKERVEES